MRPPNHSLLIFAIVLVIAGYTQSSPQEGLITVMNYPSDQYEPEINLDAHKSGDVEIYRVRIPEEGYLIVFYHDYSGKIKNYHSYKFDTINYNEGFYSWQNDTTFTLKLFNRETEIEWSVELGIRRGYTYMNLID